MFAPKPLARDTLRYAWSADHCIILFFEGGRVAWCCFVGNKSSRKVYHLSSWNYVKSSWTSGSRARLLVRNIEHLLWWIFCLIWRVCELKCHRKNLIMSQPECNMHVVIGPSRSDCNFEGALKNSSGPAKNMNHFWNMKDSRSTSRHRKGKFVSRKQWNFNKRKRKRTVFRGS